MNRTVSPEEVRSRLSYDPGTGVFRWKERAPDLCGWNKKYAGKRAGCRWQQRKGRYYWVIRFNDYPLLAHVAAWMIMTGEHPAHLIDHKDGDGENNVWTNLRPASHQQNAFNSRAPNTNTSGTKGVSFCRQTKKFRAYITKDKRQFCLGYHVRREDAAAAYAKAAADFAGEFARTI